MLGRQFLIYSLFKKKIKGNTSETLIEAPLAPQKVIRKKQKRAERKQAA